MAIMAISMFAQKNVTTFLGILVDGTYYSMKQKLIKKGFTPKKEESTEYFEGEFNGKDVKLYIYTNNNKVYCIGVHYISTNDDTLAKNYFNVLISEFESNENYISISSQEIAEDEDVEHEMLINKKYYGAVFYQKNGEDNTEVMTNNIVGFL